MNAEQLIKKYESLKSGRSQWESHWQECTDYVIPRKNNVTRVGTAGEKKGVELYDSTAPHSAELLAGALHSMLTNPTTLWFELSTGDEELDNDDDVKGWLQKAARSIHTRLNNTNFQTEIHEVYIDLDTVGTSGLSIEEEKGDTLFRFNSRHISEFVVEENNKGQIDSVYRKFSWDARQIAQEFGKENLPDEVIEKLEKGSPDKFDIIHGIYPRELSLLDEITKKTPKGYPYASQYVLLKTKTTLSESGFHETPFIVSRWSKASGETYGRSPAMKALPDIKMVNKMQETSIKSAQMTMAPPVQMPDDGFLYPLKYTPFGVNYFRSGTQDRIEPINTGARVDFGFQAIEEVRRSIRADFYVDQLQLGQGPQMTATEVNQRVEQMVRFLGPVLGRQQSELLQPMIARIVGIMLRAKALPPLPEKLDGKSWIVKYSSLVARAQRISEGENVMRVVSAVAPLAQMDPTIMDNVDTDEYVRYVADIYGTPAKLLRKKQERDKMRAARSQAQGEMMRQQQEAHAADQIAKVGPVVTQAKGTM